MSRSTHGQHQGRLRYRYGAFGTDYESILVRIVGTHSRTCASNYARTLTIIVDHGNPGACADNTKVLDGLLRVLGSREITFERFMGLANDQESRLRPAPTTSREQIIQNTKIRPVRQTNTGNTETHPSPLPDPTATPC